MFFLPVFFFSSRRRHTRLQGDWSSDVCSSDLNRALRTASTRRQSRGSSFLYFSNQSATAAATCGVADDVPSPLRRTLPGQDRKSTRLNSSHLVISYAVFCLKKKNHQNNYII